MRILVAGAKGQLGSQIINILKEGKSELGDIDPIYESSNILRIDIDNLDITSIADVQAFMEKEKPDIVINPAAYTNVDGCEENKEDAFKVNALGARNLAKACKKIGAKLIHISTDYVFEGEGTIPYCEYDVPSPVSVYGKTKLLGERYVQQFCSKYFIVRTAWLYGYNGKNFVKTIMKAAKEKGHLDVVNDQRGNPTNAEDLAHHILKVALTEEYGIYHCTGKGECSWYDFACKIVEFADIDCTVSPVTSEQYKRVAKRPSFSSLDNMMLRCTVGDEMREWEEALKVFIREYNPNFNKYKEL
ncbi:dTDP-4-dehydrorhamnose reductase [Clostridium aestuarii]|uniref:dTDP-4-dehydrorhamnose reductase n=1 Tax=Clostridium aestuarii TaxID=338193 RepID=A0ABT4CZT7_9CLOT|nr:dTDP-4-dehydrorhamnose reductase [Clostridium aestuarii]MCY6484503.1 dTDP-4-dehydrorhamnose reductase [Clostridium aestuarii]